MAATQAGDVIPLGSADYPRAGDMLGRAFRDDPLWTALIPDADERSTLLPAMFTGLTKAVIAARGVAEASPGLEAVALWLPPGRDIGPWAMVRSGFALSRFAMRMPARDRRRMMAVLGDIAERKQELMPDPHWYVPAIGVDPQHQHRGLGSALMRSGMARADEDGAPIYLETGTEGNVAFYEHLGFEVLEEMVAGQADVQLWLMIRPPHPLRPQSA